MWLWVFCICMVGCSFWSFDDFYEKLLLRYVYVVFWSRPGFSFLSTWSFFLFFLLFLIPRKIVCKRACYAFSEGGGNLSIFFLFRYYYNPPASCSAFLVRRLVWSGLVWF